MKKKVKISLLLILSLFFLTGCGLVRKSKFEEFEELDKKREEQIMVTQTIDTEVESVDIVDGKVKIPLIERKILNKETDEITIEEVKPKELLFTDGNYDELKVKDGYLIVPDKDDTITVTYTELEYKYTTTFKVKSSKKYVSFGSSTLYFGKYKAEGDLPSDFKATLTIKSDGTATYVGSKYLSNGSIKQVDLTGNWEVKAKSIAGLSGHPEDFEKVDGIFFNWSDGSTDAYGVATKYIGNQFMGYTWISE